jgi:hypothetical protein
MTHAEISLHGGGPAPNAVAGSGNMMNPRNIYHFRRPHMTRQLTLTLPEEVYLYLQLRAAIDDDRVETGVERFLCELVAAKKEARPVVIRETKFFKA